MIRLCAIGLLCVILPLPAAAQVLWRLDTSEAAAPLAGADETKGDDELGRVVDRARVAGAGPAGQDVYRFSFRHDATQLTVPAAYGGEHYLGWVVTRLDPPAAGGSRFGRIRFRVSAASNFKAVDSGKGGASQVIHKIAIVADGNPTRTIVSLHGDVASRTFELQVGRNGEGNLKVDNLRRDTWYHLQWETRFDGNPGLRIWLNTNDQERPTRAARGLTFSPEGYGWFFLGYYNNRMIAADGVYEVDIAAAEYADSFDPDWFVPGPGSKAAAPAPAADAGREEGRRP